MKYEVHHHYHDTNPEIMRRLDWIAEALSQLLGKVDDMAADFTALEAELQGITDAEAAVEKLIQTLIDAQRNTGADQARINDNVSKLQQLKTRLVAATLAGTPADPTLPAA